MPLIKVIVLILPLIRRKFTSITLGAKYAVPRAQLACEDNDDVLFYIKLPDWFKIDTPVGRYNPDWALIYKNYQQLYFVAETKGTPGAASGVAEDMLRPMEKLKIECGRRHFRNFENVHFKVVERLQDLLN